MMPHDVVDRFLDWANADPSHPAVVIDGQTFSYGDLERRVRALPTRSLVSKRRAS
jgi:acyl-CoA synthetase (AMP-forming)/AMP-acid ligase II